MPGKPLKLSQFWQELKRRKVVRVIAMYAGAAYIIIELVSNITEPLHLPGWTTTLIILLLAIGFPIAAILSWIFDVTPEGLKKTEPFIEEKEKEAAAESVKRKLRVSDVIIAVLVVIVVILAYPKIFKKDKLAKLRDEDGRISIAVMPFQNMTGDTIWDIWQDGIRNELITNLSNSKELSIRQYQTMYDILQGSEQTYSASITSTVASDISRKLEANTFILGSIKESGDIVRINVQLIDSETEEIYKTYQIDGNTEDDIFMITDSLSKLVRNYLEIKMLEQDAYVHAKMHSDSHSAEAYRYYIQGKKVQNSSEYSEAIKLYHKALDRDSCFVSALLWLTVSYMNNEQYEQARLIQKRTARYIDQAPLYEQLFYNYFKAYLDKDIQGRIKAIMRLTEEYPYEIAPYFGLGYSYNTIHQYEKASDAFDKRFELMRQLEFEEPWIILYKQAGLCYHALGQHAKEQEVYELGLRVLPDHPEIIFRQAICALSQGYTTEANKLIGKNRSIREEQGESILALTSVGKIYEEANYLDKAEKSIRHAFKIYPENAVVMNHLALFIIKHDINVNEGMELIARALEIIPDNWNFLYSHGLGLYKQGKLREAQEVLGRAWEIRPSYNHDHYLLVQEVDQSLAGRN